MAQVLVPLVQVFAPIVYCRPVENEAAETDSGGSECAELLEQGLCRFFAPAPLEADRDRFLRLVADLHNRRDDYAAQLSRLSLASLSSGSRPDQESKGSILTSLLHSHGIEDRQKEKLTLLLWQARLLLKLGEFFDAEQELLRQEMQKISEKQRGLFSELSNGPANPFSLTEQLSSSAAVAADNWQSLRMRAWARIFALGLPLPDAPAVFITRSSDAVDLLADEYERRHGSLPGLVLDLPLPAEYSGTGQPAGQRDLFRREGADLLARLDGLLADPAKVSEQDRAVFRDPDGPWGSLLERCFPAGGRDRRRLSLYDFTGIGASRLFLDSFGRDEDDGLQEKNPPAGDSGILIGLLQS
ncbi:hypothetical protein BMS3Bbin14_00104 [bacterium BMS3Bbin14]|nr:hypothetical protein BMS3Abin13_00583 [bacterium BMS3Abin13]GBE51650.1 hypothetical protein BMS3Bbin14_00104 [bacterium BMS3Bbin14]HDK43068.1 hypothetical protein [Desulfobacteraceae bacterium]HDO29579.1 hypothetical protein [Desulfobacteraceae bacterium]